jgi:hypothetical protein
VCAKSAAIERWGVLTRLCGVRGWRVRILQALPNSALIHEKNSTIHYVIINNGDA